MRVTCSKGKEEETIQYFQDEYQPTGILPNKIEGLRTINFILRKKEKTINPEKKKPWVERNICYPHYR